MRTASIRSKMTQIAIIPLTFLGFVTLVFGMLLIYDFAQDNIQDELETTTYMLKSYFDTSVRGDYLYEDGVLKKGDVNVTDSTMLYNIKANSEVDTTIFWGDTRILTTVEDDYGVSAVGTKANEEVAISVLDRGENYFSKELKIEGQNYVGYYTPLANENGSIVGMVFAGKSMEMVYNQIGKIMMWFLVVSLLAVLVAMVMSRQFSESLVGDINSLKIYLQSIASGDFTVKLDAHLMNRKDEIGEIGENVSKMSEAIKSMIELDGLTTLYNRRTCNNMIRQRVAKKQQFTFVLCDIDWFKKINDTYGHECGDCVLVSISQMLKKSVEDCGFASRWGGEEFLLIYELDIEKTREKVNQLINDLHQREFEYQGRKMKVTMTFGIKEMELDVPYETMIKVADDNLYKGKNAGRDQIVG